ncbi:MAG: hypothetical protein ACRDT4_21530, partial [Micromonosporaceae bacterium]
MIPSPAATLEAVLPPGEAPSLSVPPIAEPRDVTTGSSPAELLRGELLAADPAGLASLARMVEEITIAARAGLRRRSGPLPALTPAQLARQIDADLAGG